MLAPAIALVLAASPANAPAHPEARLSPDVRPSHYQLDLTIDPEAGTFSGEVTIEVKLAKPQPEIRLHAVELDVSAASFEPPSASASDEPVKQPLAIAPLKDDEMLSLKGKAPFPAGAAKLHLTFGAKLRTDL